MVELIRQWYQNRAGVPYVRPWGLAAPILVLLVCLPLIRPLRMVPDNPKLDRTVQTLPVGIRTGDLSDNERTRLATIQAIAERRTLAIDQTSFYPRPADVPASFAPAARHYSRQPPVLAVLLAGPYWVMTKVGLTFDNHLALTACLLTIIGATLPVALAAALVYRMGRIFELHRPWRTLLAIATVFGSGMVSYATALNAHAPAAALVLAACSALLHGGITRQQKFTPAWLTFTGGLIGFAAVIDMGAAVFVIALLAVILAMHWPISQRLAGIGWYVLGLLPPIVLHCALTIPITGDVRPGFLQADPQTGLLSFRAAEETAWGDDEAPGIAAIAISRLTFGLIGSHGLLTHFPVLLIGVLGMSMLLRRHWPAPLKVMAVVSLGGAGAIMLTYAVLNADWNQPMFAIRWFILFLPLLVFWSGVWLRNKHTPIAWGLAGLLLVFSMTTSILGATGPFTPARPGEYTVYAAARYLVKTASAQPIQARHMPPLLTKAE
jgi:hypothetical protein